VDLEAGVLERIDTERSQLIASQRTLYVKDGNDEEVEENTPTSGKEGKKTLGEGEVAEKKDERKLITAVISTKPPPRPDLPATVAQLIRVVNLRRAN